MTSDTSTHVGSGGALLAQAWAPTWSGAARVRLGACLPGWDVGAVPAVAQHLSALCAARTEVQLRGATPLDAGTSHAHGYVVTLVARDKQTPCAWLELEGPLSRALVDLALGGTADASELALVQPLDRTREGVLLYLAASVLAVVPQDALAIANITRAEDMALPTRVACAVRVQLHGRAHGAHVSVALDALPLPTEALAAALTRGALPSWARDEPCELSITIAGGALPGEVLHALQPGDLLIPAELWADSGAWRTAALCCDALGGPIARVVWDADDALLRIDTSARVADQCILRAEHFDAEPQAPGDLAAEVPFRIDAARVTMPLHELARWLRDERVPLTVDPDAPLTLYAAGRPVARGRLVRDGANVGLCVERVAATYSSAGSPNTDAYSR